MAEEQIDVLDENGNKLGVVKTRAEVHANGLWHQAAHVWIFNSKGEILLQKRSMQKESWPGLWDTSAAGHLSAGDTPKEAAIRELREELGIMAKSKDLKLIMVEKISIVPKRGYYNNEFEYVYLLHWDELPKKLQSEEVESVAFVPLNIFEKELKDPEASKKYAPNAYYQKLIRILKREMSQK